MLGVAGDQIRTQQQHTDTAFGRLWFDDLRQLHQVGMQTRLHARVVDTDLGVLGGGGHFQSGGLVWYRLLGVAVYQVQHQVVDIFLRAAQPVLQGEEIGAQVLRRAGHKPQNLRQAPQHFHLPGACGGILTGLRFAAA